MCGACEEHSRKPDIERVGDLRVTHLTDILKYAEFLAEQPEVRRRQVGFIGYGLTSPGDRVLIAVDNQYDPRIAESIAQALRSRGAVVDIISTDIGPDREFGYLDEMEAAIRKDGLSWEEKPRRWEGIPWVEDLAARRDYDLLIHGKGGPVPEMPYRYEAIPFYTLEEFMSPSTIYPREINTLVCEKTWEMIYHRGRGGRVHITDPEGTDLSYTLWDEYYDGRYGWNEKVLYGHVMGHPPTPIVEREDMTGVVAGTTSHFSRAFSRIQVRVENGRIQHIEGGAGYGDGWRELEEETSGTQYRGFPEPGLFWGWEMAIGTNPKIRRPSNIEMLSSGGFEYERLRSGVIHTGFGTFWRSPEERWCIENNLTYGHLHIHLLFPTFEVTTRDGESLRVIDHGRLTALDDPEVRDVAARFGDPDELLREDWVPSIPGISAEGDYEDYAKDPAKYIYRPGVMGV
jgi:hypothetical protein